LSIPLQSIERIELRRAIAVPSSTVTTRWAVSLTLSPRPAQEPQSQSRCVSKVAWAPSSSSQGNVSLTTNHGPWSSAAFANVFSLTAIASATKPTSTTVGGPLYNRWLQCLFESVRR
jgi:hypothetical protein